MDRLIEYTNKANEDFLFFKKQGQNRVFKKIHQLIESIKINPFKGIGKPEPLKHELSGYWLKPQTIT